MTCVTELACHVHVIIPLLSSTDMVSNAEVRRLKRIKQSISRIRAVILNFTMTRFT